MTVCSMSIRRISRRSTALLLSTSTSFARTRVISGGIRSVTNSDTGTAKAFDKLNTVSIVGLPEPLSSWDSVPFAMDDRRASSDRDNPRCSRNALMLAPST